MNAKTISTDLWRCTVTMFARDLQCLNSLLDKAAADGKKRVVAARIDVKRNADWACTNDTVWIRGSRPHRVCARFW